MAKKLTSSEKAKARRTLAKKRGVSESQINDTDLMDAFSAGVISYSDCGISSSFDSGGYSGGYSGGGDSGGSACY